MRKQVWFNFKIYCCSPRAAEVTLYMCSVNYNIHFCAMPIYITNVNILAWTRVRTDGLTLQATDTDRA